MLTDNVSCRVDSFYYSGGRGSGVDLASLPRVDFVLTSMSTACELQMFSCRPGKGGENYYDPSSDSGCVGVCYRGYGGGGGGLLVDGRGPTPPHSTWGSQYDGQGYGGGGSANFNNLAEKSGVVMISYN